MLKKVFATILFFSAIAVVPVFSKEVSPYESLKIEKEKKDWYNKFWEINLDFGIKSGEMREYVFDKVNTDTTQRQLSRLDWKVKIPYLRIGGNFNVKNVVLGTDFLFGFGGKNGNSMDDWDWMGDDPERATHFSTHDVDNKLYFECNIKAGYKFQLGDFSVIPMGGFMFRDFLYEGWDGYKQYSTEHRSQATDGQYWNDSITKTSLSGNSIDYEQKTFMPYLRLEGDWDFYRNMKWKVFFNYSPYFWVNANDDHDGKNKFYRDEMKGGYSLTAGTEVYWNCFILGFSYEFLTVKEGISGLSSTKGNYKKNSSTPGTESKYWNFYIRIRI